MKWKYKFSINFSTDVQIYFTPFYMNRAEKVKQVSFINRGIMNVTQNTS